MLVVWEWIGAAWKNGGVRERLTLNARNGEPTSKLWLSGGRRAGRAMRRERIQREKHWGRRNLPGYLLRFRKEGQRSSRQGGHVQNLADRANAVGSTGMLVDKNAATGEIQQSNAA